MNIITLNRNKHESFLADHRKDPLTKDLLQVGDKIVVCANCKTVYLEDTWNLKKHCFANPKDCECTETLAEIPLTVTNKKNIRKSKTFVLGSIVLILISVVASIFLSLNYKNNTPLINTNIVRSKILGSYSGRIITENDTVVAYLSIRESALSDSLKLSFKTSTHSFSFYGYYKTFENSTIINAPINFIVYSQGSFLYLNSKLEYKNNSIWEFSKSTSY